MKKSITPMVMLTLSGMVAPMTVEAATDGEIFLAYVDQFFGPNLRPEDVVVMGNLSAHKVDGVRQLIEAKGAKLLHLPPYCPDLNPIEKAWSKIKQIPRAIKPARPKRSTRPSPRHSLTLPQTMREAWFRLCMTGYSKS